MTIGFAWLGTWQLERRVWKRDLIARVEQRLAAPPAAAPGPREWSKVTRSNDEYRRVRLTGTFVPDRRTLVSATTMLGPGYWLMVAFRDARGFTVLINRGFVPSADTVTSPGGGSVTGLLRLTEPRGDLLRTNDAARDRWFSRDVAAIAATQRLGAAAPYFVDATASGGSGYPRGGLTVVAFSNNHLVYALTWYALAVLTAAATIVAFRTRAARRRDNDQ